jgi:hypothetical protein
LNGGGDGCADGGGGGVSGVDVGVGSVGVGTGVDGLAARVLGVPKAVPEAAPKAAPKATPEAVPEAAPEAAPAAGARRLAHSSGARRRVLADVRGHCENSGVGSGVDSLKGKRAQVRRETYAYLREGKRGR